MLIEIGHDELVRCSEATQIKKALGRLGIPILIADVPHQRWKWSGTVHYLLPTNSPHDRSQRQQAVASEPDGEAFPDPPVWDGMANADQTASITGNRRRISGTAG